MTKISLILCSVIGMGLSNATMHSHDRALEDILIDRLDRTTRFELPQETICNLRKLVSPTAPFDIQRTLPKITQQPLLFKAYPALIQKIAFLNICNLPTPIVKVTDKAKGNLTNLFLKNDRDDFYWIAEKITYSNQNIRHLDFLYADATAHNIKDIFYTNATMRHLQAMTYVTYGKPENLFTCWHVTNPDGDIVPDIMGYADIFFRQKKDYGVFPYLIPSHSCLDALGFLNAAFELKEQIAQGCMPEPDVIFLPADYAGVAGFILGLQVVGLKSSVVMLHNEPAKLVATLEARVRNLFAETNTYMHEGDPSFPVCNFPADTFIALAGYEGYVYLPKGTPQEQWSMIDLPDYYGKFHCYNTSSWKVMLSYCEKNNLNDKVVLFWSSVFNDDCFGAMRWHY